MTEINVSAHTPYHTQVNNRYYPHSSCNTTSAIMWMLDCGIPVPDTAPVQPEDYLTGISELPEAYELMRQVAPWAYRNGRPALRPAMVHECLDWAINRFAGRRVVDFRTDLLFQDLVAELARGRAVIVSGSFTPQGHMVCLVGVRTRQERAGLEDPARVHIEQIDGWIVDDPYGNYHSAYRDPRGNDMLFFFDELDRLLKYPCQNRKWGHVFVG